MLETQTPVQQDPFSEPFARIEESNLREPSWDFPIRKAGIARFAELGFPTLRDEDWRFTNIAPLVQRPFHPLFRDSGSEFAPERVREFNFTGLDAHRLVFVDGNFSPELSTIFPEKDGATVGSLAAAISQERQRIEPHLARHVRGDHNAFAALNTAFFQDGAYIMVPRGVTLARPVHLLFVGASTHPGVAIHPRNLIVAEEGSGLTVIESYVSAGEGERFTNAAAEFVIGDGAIVEHCKFQDENASSFHMGSLHAQLGRDCRFVSHSIALGGRIARNHLNMTLGGAGAQCVLNGVYLAKDDQLVDHHMVVDHAEPRCESHEYFNGVLDDRARGVFHGRIFVRQEAQKTDAKQTNKNLLLSDEATIDTKPQLEIYADDVKCTHGATVGQLNPESIFYLRARGIGAAMAKQMLIHAFAGEITERIECAPLREETDRVVWDRLEENPHLAEVAGA